MGGLLLSLRQLDLPVKLIVFNNSALAFVELEMKAAGMLDFATDLRNPDFAKMAEAAGVLGLKANAPGKSTPSWPQALSHPGRLSSKLWSTVRNLRCRRRLSWIKQRVSVFS